MSRYGGIRHRQEPAVPVPRSTARDDTISYRDLGVLANLGSHADGWVVRAEQLARAGEARKGREGREAVRTVLRSLYARGYYRQEKRRFRDEVGRWVWASGGSLSLSPVPEWAQQYQRFGGKQVVLVQQTDDDSHFRVRWPDGTWGPDEWITPVDGADDTPADDESDRPDTPSDFGDGFSGPGNDGEANPQVTPEYGFSGSGISGPENPAAENPEPSGPGPFSNNNMKGNHQENPSGGSPLPTVGGNPQSNARTRSLANLRQGGGGKRRQPGQEALTPDLDPPPPAPPSVEERAYGVARAWLATFAERNLPVRGPGGKDPVIALKALIRPRLAQDEASPADLANGYTDTEAKWALKLCGRDGQPEPIPSAAEFERALRRARSGERPGQPRRRLTAAPKPDLWGDTPIPDDWGTSAATG
jgi:hypothetical protein